MSSEALERIRELAESGRLHTWDIRPASDGHMSAVEADVSPDVLALLAEVARLEQAVGDVTRDRAAAGLRLHRAEHEAAEWRKALLSESSQRSQAAYDAMAAALAVARERDQRLREKIEHVIADSPGTPATVKQFLRAALVDEPAAATLMEPEQAERREHQRLDAPVKGTPPGAASAAADEPGETPA